MSNVVQLIPLLPGGQCRPEIAYNRDRDEFFVVHSQEKGGGECYSTSAGVVGQRIPVTSSTVYTAIDLDITGQYVSADYVKSTRSYLVVYDDGHGVYGLWLGEDGHPDPQGSFQLASDSKLSRLVSDEDGAFVVWIAMPAYGISTIYGCYVNASDNHCHTEPFGISAPFNKSQYPDVAYAPGTSHTLATWLEGNINTGYRIYGRMIIRSGITGTTFYIGNGNAYSRPAIEYHAQDNAFLVSWAANGALWGRYISGDGILQGEPFRISSKVYTEIGRRAGVAVNQATGLWIASWTSQTLAGGADVHARYLESVHPHDLALRATRDGEKQPAGTYNPDSGEFLMAGINTRGITPTLEA